MAMIKSITTSSKFGLSGVSCTSVSLLNQLDAGEAETIILAKEVDADFVIIDENIGYHFATSAGLTVVRTLSILLRAKEKGYIDQVKPLIDGMIDRGRWYSEAVRRAVLERAGEFAGN